MAQTSSWHKPEDRIFIVIGFLSVKLMHFYMPHEEVDMTTEII